MGNRKLKKKILELLGSDDFVKSLEDICRMPARQAINPLFSFFYNIDERIRWRAITAMGAVVSRLADENMESARVVMRRLIWNLNDESGGIGWGSPEAMGDIMARHGGLADEYARILVSYVDENGNFLEHETLQRGVLWGLGRLAHARPELVKQASPFLHPFLQSEDAIHRGLAAWISGAIQSASAKPLLQNLADDNTIIEIFMNMHLKKFTVGRLAGEALSKLEN
ncbi:MAG: HEAT repeat domain-containing protein [Deltaproteobacteria bacterium]|nr:HEAT repeat domain-containing protein [Deltaproteobacteria bacterium]